MCDDGKREKEKGMQQEQEQKQHQQCYLRGVLFGRSVRSSYASLNFALFKDDDEVPKKDETENVENHILIRIQYMMEQEEGQENGRDDENNDEEEGNGHHYNQKPIKELRSFCRRYFKLGDLLLFKYNKIESSDDSNINIAEWKEVDTNVVKTGWINPRFVINIHSEEDLKKTVVVEKVRFWNMIECQQWQQKCNVLQKLNSIQKQGRKKIKKKQTAQMKQKEASTCNAHSGGGLGKRQQGEYVANFLVHMIMDMMIKRNQQRCDDNNNGRIKTGEPSTRTVERSGFFNDPSKWATTFPDTKNKVRTTTDDNINNEMTDSKKVNINKTIILEQEETENLMQQKQLRNEAIAFLNVNHGVVDVAGGSGHVSMALGTLGIQSTIVDPRENIGKLPGRDRKIWKRVLKKMGKAQESDHNPLLTAPLYCQPVNSNTLPPRPYSTYRGWFGDPPVGVDTSFRHPDKEREDYEQEKKGSLVLPNFVTDTTNNSDGNNHNDSNIHNYSAIVALHPDEATDAIVTVAVEYKIPFIIVPCCVFNRLFPNRFYYKNGTDDNTNEPTPDDKQCNDDRTKTTKKEKVFVSSYDDLVQYILSKDPSIQKVTLPFEGANTILWSTFDNNNKI